MTNQNKVYLLAGLTILFVSFQNFMPTTDKTPRLKPAKDIQVNGRLRKIESEHLLVKFKDSVSEERLDEILSRHNISRVEKIGEGHLGSLHRVHVSPGKEEETLAQLKVSTEVEYAEFNELVPAKALPNDSLVNDQWHLSNVGASQAWDQSIGSNSVTVAILDSGVDVSHPDLSARIVSGYNIVDGNTNVADVAGHGTAVAGVAVVDTNNALGLGSLCWNCKIMPVRIAVLQNGSAYAYYSTIASGMQWAVDHGARVLNCSYGGIYASSSIASAATYVKQRGGIVFVSMGNDNQLVTSNVALDVIFVGSTNESNQKSGFSNYGPVMSLSAPGENMLTTSNGGGYSRWNGTSFASPLVAGAAALIWSSNPTLSESQVRSILLQSSDDLGAVGKDDQFGAGKLNAFKAVQMALSSTAPATTPSTTTTLGASTTTTTVPTTTTTVLSSPKDTTAPTVQILSPAANATVTRTVSVSVKATDNISVSKVSLYVDGNLMGSSTSAPFSISWNTKKTATGLHNLSVKAFDAAGNVGVSSAVSVQVVR